MKIFTYKSLNEAIKLCQENDKYRVLIVTQYASDHSSILDYLHKIGIDVTRCFGNPWAKFPNGSIIRMTSLVNSMRGQKANLILCQDEVYNSCEDIGYVLDAIEIMSFQHY